MEPGRPTKCKRNHPESETPNDHQNSVKIGSTKSNKLPRNVTKNNQTSWEYYEKCLDIYEGFLDVYGVSLDNPEGLLDYPWEIRKALRVFFAVASFVSVSEKVTLS